MMYAAVHVDILFISVPYSTRLSVQL